MVLTKKQQDYLSLLNFINTLTLRTKNSEIFFKPYSEN